MRSGHERFDLNLLMRSFRVFSFAKHLGGVQTRILYPWMLRHASGAVCERVHRHRDDMGWLLASFLEMCAQWSTAASIATDPQGFVRAWKDVRAMLFAHVEAEQGGLYDLADGCIQERPALAS
jgi:hypothetical protein